jgi:hypothetical protein
MHEFAVADAEEEVEEPMAGGDEKRSDRGSDLSLGGPRRLEMLQGETRKGLWTSKNNHIGSHMTSETKRVDTSVTVVPTPC